jgi:hypothetical protein
MILKLLAAIAQFIFRRGTGLFKFLFVIDDFIRVFTMTFLFMILFTWLRAHYIVVTAFALLGLVIDLHDFISDNELAKFFD